jgi:phage-related protein
MDERSTRLLHWEGSSRKSFKAFPIPVQKDLGVALFVVQLGRMPSACKPWKGLGSGVFELLDDYMGDTFRVFLLLKGSANVHVLHAFKKKSKDGVRTPATDVALVTARCRSVRSRTENTED